MLQSQGNCSFHLSINKLSKNMKIKVQVSSKRYDEICKIHFEKLFSIHINYIYVIL